MIADLTPYPEYQQTGLPWVGQVPRHWDLRRMKSAVRNVVEQTFEMRPGEVYLALEHVESWTGRARPQADSNLFTGQVKRFRQGDVLFGKLRPYLAKVTRIDTDGVCAGEFFVFRPTDNLLSPQYLEQQLRAKHTIDVINGSTFGAKMPRADWQFVGNLPIPLPPPEEQGAIVRFLDWANGRLERAIRAKRKVIALLNEQKQAIIHRAVTRGLDPNVALKPSGIPWLGDIPAHWEVRRLKNVGETQIGLTYSPADLTDESGTLVLRASNIKEGKLVSADNVFVKGRIPDKVRVKRNDILICARSGSRNLVGKSALIPDHFEGVAFGAFMSLFRSSWNDFVFWVLNSNLFKFVMAEFETSTINQLTQGDLNNLVIPIPPRQEQLAIVSCVKEKTSSLDAAISRLESEIELLREYRTRLVADVVSGKLDVRAAAVRLRVDSRHRDIDVTESEPDDTETDMDTDTQAL